MVITKHGVNFGQQTVSGYDEGSIYI